MDSTIRLRIKRRDHPQAEPYWENFEIPHRGALNIINCLMEIQKRPINAKGEPTTPIVWDQACLEEVCGSCSMLINGRVRQACSALVDQLTTPITLEPMSKFPCIRDLRVDRQQMFENLKRVKAWIPIDGTHAIGPGPRLSAQEQQVAYELSRCMTCGCCLEACPQYNDKSDFIGAAALSQVRLFNMHPTGALSAHERLDAIMGEGGLEACGNAQMCVQACPKNIPLTTSIAELEHDATKRILKRWLGK